MGSGFAALLGIAGALSAVATDARASSDSAIISWNPDSLAALAASDTASVGQDSVVRAVAAAGPKEDAGPLTPREVWESTRPRFYFYAGMGVFRLASASGGLQGGGSRLALDAVYGYELRPHLAIEGRFLTALATYDAPPPPATDAEYEPSMNLSTVGFGVGLRAFTGLGPVQTYARASLNMMQSKLTWEYTTYDWFWIFPIPQNNQLSDDTFGPSLSVGLGIDLPMGDWFVGIEAGEVFFTSGDFSQFDASYGRLGMQTLTFHLGHRGKTWRS